MSILDKVVAAITPPESDEARAEATAKARSAAGAGDWLSHALDHHQQIRDAFQAGLDVPGAPGRLAAFQRLALVLNGHSLAEELVLYPALAKAGEKAHASAAYLEQTTAKMQLAEIERLDPAGQDWIDNWKSLQGAILHHIYEEEGGWFLEIKSQYEDQGRLTTRFLEEFDRYVGGAEQASLGLAGAGA